MSQKISQTAARHLVDALVAQGVTHAFCVPGESYLAVLDALHDVRDKIRLIVCRHETAAANAAEAYGKLTGKPGVCFVTRGPGATQGSVGVHTAFQDSTPMILFIGQVARDQFDREAFQEIEYRRMFAPLAKWAAQIDVAARTPEYVARAFATALNGRQGPVVLALPEDMLTEECEAVPAPRVDRAMSAPTAEQIAKVKELFLRADRPFIIAGGGGWTPEAVIHLRSFVERSGAPCGLSFRCKDLLDNRHQLYAGDVALGINPKLARRIGEADLVIALGARLGEATTGGYTLLESPVPEQTLIHIHPGAEEVGRVYQAALGVNASPPAALKALLTLSINGSRWAEWARAAREEYEAFAKPVEVEEGVNLSKVWAHLSKVLPDDAIVTNGAGNYAAWLHRFYQHKGFRTQLAPTSGAMGYGVPAAIAAKAVCPERTVVCAAGDGCFMMAASELATAAQYDLPVIFLVSNNGVYGTIRMHQEREYPGRVSGTDIVNPDFAALARAYGAHGETVEKTEDFPAAFKAAVESGKPAVLDLRTSAEHIAPGKTLSGLAGG